MVRTLNPARRAEFLSAALRLFAAQGLEHTSTAEIAKEAGSAAGTLFLYFPTKQDLINELVLSLSREQSETIRALLSPELTARQSFAAIWSGTLHWFMENMDAYRYVQQVRAAGTLAPEVVEQSNQFFGYYYEAIQKGLAEGSLKPYPPELIGEYLYQDLVAVMSLVQNQPDPAQREAYLQQGFEIYWDGIKKSGDISPKEEARREI